MTESIPTDVVRIGLIGAGEIVKQRHMPGFRALPNVRLSAVANSTLESAASFCHEWAPEARAVAQWERVVEADDVDVVWIGTPPHLHCEITCRALAARKHVFTQARMAGSLSEAECMLEASRRHPHLVTAICPADSGIRHGLMVERMLTEDRIGRPHEALLHSFSPRWLDRHAPPHWRQRVELSGHNILTLGIYVEVLQKWLGHIVEVEARGNIVIPVRDGYDIRTPDFVHVLAKFESGLEATLSFSGVAAHAPGDRLWLFGSKGTLAYDFESDEVLLGMNGHDLKPVTVPVDLQRDWTVESDFISAVANPAAPRPRPDFAEGVRYMRVVEAVWASLAQRRGIGCP